MPRLSHESVTLLVQHYFKDLPPVVTIDRAAERAKTRSDDALAESGLFSTNVGTGSCGAPLTFHALTIRGREVASQRGWDTSFFNGQYVRISVGSFSLITESLTYTKLPGLPGSIHFMYWFRGNANVPYLLSRAPASVWGSVGMNDAGGVGLDKANRLLEGTLPIMSGGAGWVIERTWGAVGMPQC